MAISGHKTRSVFDRYNIVDEADLKSAAGRLQEYINREKVTLSVTLAELQEESPEVVEWEVVGNKGEGLEPATWIEQATCGLRIAMFPTPARQIKNIAVQTAAKQSNASAIPQLSATRIPQLLRVQPTLFLLTRSSRYESMPRTPLTSK